MEGARRAAVSSTAPHDSRRNSTFLRGLDHIFGERFRLIARYHSAVEELFSSIAFFIFRCAWICNGAMACSCGFSCSGLASWLTSMQLPFGSRPAVEFHAGRTMNGSPMASVFLQWWIDTRNAVAHLLAAIAHHPGRHLLTAWSWCSCLAARVNRGKLRRVFSGAMRGLLHGATACPVLATRLDDNLEHTDGLTNVNGIILTGRLEGVRKAPGSTRSGQVARVHVPPASTKRCLLVIPLSQAPRCSLSPHGVQSLRAGRDARPASSSCLRFCARASSRGHFLFGNRGPPEVGGGRGWIHGRPGVQGRRDALHAPRVAVRIRR